MRKQNTIASHGDETAASFKSRLAAASGVPSIGELLMDAEHSIAEFLKCDAEIFDTFAALGGVRAMLLIRLSLLADLIH